MSSSKQCMRLLLRLEALIPEQCMSRLGAPLYNEKGEVFNPASGLDPFDPKDTDGNALPPYIYYNPRDLDSFSHKPFGLKGDVVCYVGNQPNHNYRANTRKSIMAWNQIRSNEEMETRDVMYLYAFDRLKLKTLIPLPGVEMDDEEDVDYVQPDPVIPIGPPWNTAIDLLPMMRAIALHRYGKSDVSVLYNITGYNMHYGYQDWPGTTEFYVHVRDPMLPYCTIPGRRWSTDRVSLQLCIINASHVECVLVKFEVYGNLLWISAGQDDNSVKCEFVKIDEGRGGLLLGSTCMPFNSWDELRRLVRVFIGDDEMTVDQDGREVRVAQEWEDDWHD